MALADLTFKIYDQSSLSSAFGGTFQLTHESDLSDNPQQFTKWFGSAQANRVLKASSNPGVDQITLTPTYILPDWEASTAYSLGDSVRPTTPDGYRYECTQAGTSDGSEPTWPGAGIGSTVSDNTVEWTLVAEDRPTTEITLALTEAALATNTPGASLDIGTEIDSGSANAVEIWIELNNTITTVSDTFGTPELAIQIESVKEYST